MAKPREAATTCKQCNRVVYVSDVDAQGLCCFCQKPQAKPDVSTDNAATTVTTPRVHNVVAPKKSQAE